jgi:lipopolysaccharide heptosyltransferase II
MLTKAFNNILVLGHSNIGDVCCDLVIIHPLHVQFPAAKITFLTNPRCKSLVDNYPGIDNIITFDRKGGNKSLLRRLRLINELRREKYDLVIILKHSLMHKFLNIKEKWSLREYLHCLPAERKMHAADIYLELLNAHGVTASKAIWSFDPKEDDYCRTFFRLENITPQDTIIGIMPFSNWSKKDWPIDKWGELVIDITRRFDTKILVFGKTNNDLSDQKISFTFKSNVISLMNKTTLTQAMALIKKCDIFIGSDSSLLHLASCMGVESIGLYGATSKDYIYPYFHRHNICSPRAKLECMPCYPGPQKCLCNERALSETPCMGGITVEDVIGVLNNRLKNKRGTRNKLYL